MPMRKRIISFILVCVLFFTGLPAQFLNLGGSSYAYAESGTTAVDIRNDDFSDTESLQLNGETLIAGNALRFDSGAGAGESVFTKEKAALGENLSFSTAFSFRNISPSSPAAGTKGGFTFTLQSAANTLTTGDFHDESISPSLSIAFTADYIESGGPIASIFEHAETLNLAALSNFTLAEGTITRCQMSAIPYTNGAFNTPILQWLLGTYSVQNETSDPYQVWIGYDGAEKRLHMLYLTPSSGYMYYSADIDIIGMFPENEVYAGFMGSMGNSGSISEISSWHFKNDFSIFDAAVADADKELLIHIMEDYETYPIDYNIPSNGYYGSNISWESSNTDVVAEDGAVTPPTLEEGPQTVQLTATLTKGSATRVTRTFVITVKVPDDVIAEADYEWLTESVILNGNDSLNNIQSDLNLPATGEHGSTISWSSNYTMAVNWDGAVTRPGYADGDVNVTLTANIHMIREKTFNVTVKALGLSDEEIIQADSSWLNMNKLLNGNLHQDLIEGNLSLPTLGQYGSTISWSSSNPDYINDAGTVTRPSYTSGDKTVVLTATISKGTSFDTKEFTVIVITAEQTDEERLDADYAWLTDAIIQKDNTSLDNIVGELYLPGSGWNGSAIQWESSNESVVYTNGFVTRPSFTDGDKTVTLTATLRKGTFTETKEFTVKVIRLEQTNAEKLAADDAWLSTEILRNGNSALDQVTGDLYLPVVGPNESAINWTSAKPAIVNIAGIVTRPLYTTGDQTLILTAVISNGSSITKTFTVTVKAAEPTDEEIVSLDAEALTMEQILNGNPSSDNIIGSLSLPGNGAMGSIILWQSDDEAVIDTDGNIIRPVLAVGDKTVTLTATLTKGSSTVTKAFTVIVKALDETDSEAVETALAWLTPYMTDVNGALDNVSSNLILPNEGPGGTILTWTSDNPEVLDNTGKVTRPTYTAGDKAVTLTAVLQRGSVTAEALFTIIVKKLDQSAREKVDADIAWLTDALILNGNSAPDNIISDLTLPVVGENGSNIVWRPSDTSIIAIDGKITRPSYISRDKTITVTAVISLGEEASEEKSFVLVVKALPVTDREAAELDYQWISRFNTLGLNLSKNAVTHNLSFPVTGPNLSTIAWESDTPSVISNSGMVNRPEQGLGHRAVKVTAAITKGDARYTLEFNYVVFEQPDTIAPEVVITYPDNDELVPWDIDSISVFFSEKIIAGSTGLQNYGITLTGAEEARFNVQIQEDMLLITLNRDLSTGENRLNIPAGVFTDAAGNPNTAFEMKFTVEARPARTIEILSTTPQDLAVNVRISDKMQIRFDTTGLQLGDGRDGILLRDKNGDSVAVTASVSGDTLTVQTADSKSLRWGTVFELYIPEGVIQDSYGYINAPKTIQFRTMYGNENPQVVSTNPSNGQTGVNVNQTDIYVTLSDYTSFSQFPMRLTDDKGNSYALSASFAGTNESGVLFRLKPYTLRQFEANTTYTLSGPYSTVDNPNLLEFNTSFSTGQGRLYLTGYSPASIYSEASVDTSVEFRFNIPVHRGSAHGNITLKDSGGNPVAFRIEEIPNGERLIPLSKLSSWTTYKVNIPEGAYAGDGDIINDGFSWSFTTQILMDISLKDLVIPNRGFVNKQLLFNAANAEYVARSWQRQIVSCQWRIDGEVLGTNRHIYHTFTAEGDHTLELTLQDSKGYTYTLSETIEIQPVNDVIMSLQSHDGTLNILIAQPDGSILGQNEYKLKLMQDGMFIHGEVISLTLYKDGVQQKTARLRAGTQDDFYSYKYTPQYGDLGNYELEFSYEGPSGKQTIRVPVRVHSREPLYAQEFTFRLYDQMVYPGGKFFEEADYLDITLNGRKLTAVKKWYPEKNYSVYAVLDQDIPANARYEVQVSAWKNNNSTNTVYVGKDGSDPVVIYGTVLRPDWVTVSINDAESTIKEPTNLLYFEGVSAKLAMNVMTDWRGFGEGGYYEVKTEDNRFNQKFKSNGRDSQTISIDPGLHLKAGDKLLVRAINKYGIASQWDYCPYINIVTQPYFLGKKVKVSVQSGEYAVTWPTSFAEAMGGTIGFLDGLPVIGGASFGIGSGLPTFGGGLYSDNIYYPALSLSFAASGGYSQKKTKTFDKTFMKLKKVKAVGYELELAVEGDFSMGYNTEKKQWYMSSYEVSLNGDLAKTWSQGYKKLGVGFEAGVGIGGRAGGTLTMYEPGEYRGLIEFEPYAFLFVDGDFAIAAVYGRLEASLPAYIYFYGSTYIGVSVDVDLDITARALLWTKTLYSRKLVSVGWDSGMEKKSLMSASMLSKSIAENEGSEFELMPREYGTRPTVWLGGEEAFLLPKNTYASIRSAAPFGAADAAAEQNPKLVILMENIYPDAEPRLVVNSDDQWLVWTDDNPERDAVNRTQLRYSVNQDGVWLQPVWLDDDGTADFTPAVAAVDGGVLMAWHDISKPITEEDGLDEMLKSSEISVTETVLTADGSTPVIRQLTDDQSIDHSPVLASNGSEALLVWVKAEELGLSMDEEETSKPAEGSQLYYAKWNDGTWSDPASIGSNDGTVLNTSLSMEGNEGLLLYTLDLDNNLSTPEDQEIYARVYDGSNWGEAIRLTNNTVMDSAPRTVYTDGQWFITWLQEGKVQYRKGLDGVTESVEFSQAVQGDYQLVAQPGSRPLIALLYSKTGTNKGKGISAAFYDTASGLWGDEVYLVTPGEYSGEMSGAFDENGKLNMSYTEAKIITEAVPDDNGTLVESTTVSDKVDLKHLSYTPIRDIALRNEDGIYLSTEFPMPETVTTVYVTLRNEGDFSENAVVYLYDGNPDNGGRLIAQSAQQQVPARSAKELAIDWLVDPEEKEGYHLYAVARPVEDIHEINENNNVIDLKFSNADAAIEGLKCENIAANNYQVVAAIANKGSIAMEGITVRVEAHGRVISSKTIGQLDVGQKIPVSFMFSSEGLTMDEQADLMMNLIPPVGVEEEFTTNNSQSFLLVPAAIEVESVNPGPGDKQVSPSASLVLTFNMNIEESTGFDSIKLIDGFLNEIAVQKSIEGNALTITPIDELEYGTEFTLLIPADALGDSYGHSMTEDKTYSFTTMTTNPEVVFAYPGEFMENTDLNTEIRLKYNQNVQKGPFFSEITLYREGDEKISTSAAISGEILTLSYSGKLDMSTAYTMQVPVGAVQNDMGESQDGDYKLTFYTADADDGGDNGGGDNSGGETGGNNNTGNTNSSQPTPTPQHYQAEISLSGSDKTVDLRVEDQKAVLDMGDLAGEIFAGDQNVVIDIPSVPDVNSYTLQMPAGVLSSPGASSMTVHSPWGSVTIPSGMLSAMQGISGTTAGITIAAGDPSTLPEDVRAAIGDRPILQLTLTLDDMEVNWSNPSTPVTVTIPYTPTAGEEEDPESIVIWFIDAEGNIITMPNGYYRPSTETVSFTTTHFSDFAVAFNPVHFSDVPEDAWYNSAVSYIAAREITTGTGNGNFSPNSRLNRAQAITLIMRAYGIAPDFNATDNFSDSGDTWYTGYLAEAKRLGISKGVGNNLFAPENEITRQEMFTLLYNALKAIGQLPSETNSLEGTLDSFTDAELIESWAKEAMTLLAETGIIKGNNGKLMPLDTTTRAEMAQVLYNLMTR